MKKMRLPCLALLSAFSACALQAQFDRGVLVGSVHDASGAAVPGVTVVLQQTATSTAENTVSNRSGDYVFNDVLPGEYRISAHADGFRVVAALTVTVLVGEHRRVDITLSPGSVSEQVTVSAAPAALETDSSDRSFVINPTEVVNLPLNGRDPADLALLVPGVNKSSLEIEGATSREASYNVNGLRSQMNSFLLDGLDNNNWSLNDLGFSYREIQLSPDALSEFRFTTGNQNAEFGQAAGGLMNEVSRSGGNALHATLWEYLRNTVFNANGPIPSVNGAKSALVQNQFGAAIGGPIRRDKLFYFADYEGFRRVLRAAQQATLPTALQAAGTFADQTGKPISITNPYTNAVYANGIIPIAALQAGGQINPLALLVLGDLPARQLTTQTSGTGNNYTSFPRGTENIDKGDGRADYYINSRMTTFVRYSQRVFNAFDPAAIPAPVYSTSKGFIHSQNKQLAMAYTWQINTASALDARLGVTWNRNTQLPSSLGQANLLAQAGIPNAPSDPTYANGLNTTTVTGFAQFGRTNSLPTTVNPYVVDPKVNYTLLRGHHSLKFGYEYLHVSSVVSNFKPLFGADTYSGQFSKGKVSTYNTADPSYQQAWNLADFIFGARSKYELSALHFVELNQRLHYGYAQDDWRVNNRLTVNLGLRYENATPPFETNNQLANYNPVTSPVSGALITAGNGSIYNRALVNRNNLNFAPRIGFSLQATEKTVVRAAYGISYQQFLRAATANELAQNAPYNLDVLITQYAPSSKTPQAVCASQTASPLSCFQPTQQGYLNNLLTVANSSPLSTTTTYDTANTPTGYVQSYQLSVQREIAPRTVLDIAYVGAHGVHEQILTDLNQAAPNAANASLSLQARRPIANFGGIQQSYNGGASLFNALEVTLEKRLSHGLYLMSSFTWSHAQDSAAANQEPGNGDTIFVNRNNPSATFTRSAYDVPLRDNLALVYSLPFDDAAHPIANYALGGWQLTAINTFSNGTPINLTYSPVTAQQISSLSNYVYQANLSGNPVLAPGARVRTAAGQYQYLDPGAVAAPTAANTPMGNAPRNVARAPNFNELDFGLHKRFPLGFHESALEFRAEAFNLLNHPNGQSPDANRSDSAFGVISSYFPSRELQLALRLEF